MECKSFGVYDTSLSPAKIAKRRADIIKRCKEAKLPAPNFDHPDFLSATVSACLVPVRVWLVGSILDVRAPSEGDALQRGFSDAEWREAWLEYLTEESLAWLPTDRPSGVATESLTRVSVLRSYRRAWKALVKALAHERAARSKRERSEGEPSYTAGRPPYGYRVKGGILVHDTAEVREVVRQVYLLARNRTPIKTIADQMAAKERSLPKQERPWWDSVKIRRLLEHAPLYCLGEYRRRGRVTQAPELAFLPADWANTSPYRRRSSAVPRRSGSGKMMASAHHPT